MKTLIKLPQEQFDLVKEQIYLGLHCITRPNLRVQMIEILQATKYNTRKGALQADANYNDLKQHV